MQGLIVIATLIALVASFVVISTRTTKPVKVTTQPKRRMLSRPSKDRQKRYYQRKIRTLQAQRQQEQHQWLALLAVVLYHQYRAEQATPIYN